MKAIPLTVVILLSLASPAFGFGTLKKLCPMLVTNWRDESASPATVFVAMPSVDWMGETQPVRDDTRFRIGRVNTTASIRQLVELNGVPIRELEAEMRPGGMSNSGFLGREELLLDVLAADNDFVLRQGLTHQQIAAHLRPLLRQPINPSLIRYQDRRYVINEVASLGFQSSPFRGGERSANTDSIIINLDTGGFIVVNSLVLDMIERYGFYEGRGTDYRVDPEDILNVLDFLRPR